MTDSNYEVIVIGAGLGGLVCASRLSKNGMKVLLAEQHTEPGGYCTSFKRKGFTFDVVAALFGAGPGEILDPIMEELEVHDKLELIKFKELCSFIFPDLHISLPGNLDEAIKVLMDHFPEDKKGIENFFSAGKAIFRGENRELMDQYSRFTLENFVRKTISDEKLRCILSGLWSPGTPPSRASALAGIIIWILTFLHHCYYPRGGFQSLANVLAETVRKYDGEVRLNSKVKKILLQSGKVLGVEFTDGDKARAPFIVSNTDACSTFFNLIGTENLPPEYVESLKSMRPSLSAFEVWLGLDIDPRQLSKLSPINFIHRGPDLNAAYSAIQQGDLGDRITICIPSFVDPSIAPKDMHSLLIFSMAPYESKINWKKDKDKITRLLVNRAEEIIPGLSKHIIVMESASPLTMERYTSNSKGAAAGWEATPDQIGENGLSQTTPLKGLFLAGHWTSPGGGMSSAMISGWQAAEMIMKNA